MTRPATDYRYVGKDRMGIPRVYGDGPTADVAETECCKAVREYVARRPDTGPVIDWTVTLHVRP